jgi:5-methylcytosine-specific restriction endonuclease McrA
MKDEEAVRLLAESLDKIDSLKGSCKSSYEHTKWNLDTLNLLEEIFGDTSTVYAEFTHLTWQNRGNFRLTMHPEKELEYQNRQGYLTDLETARGIIKSAMDLIKRKGIETFQGKKSPKIEKKKTKKRVRLTPKQREYVWEHKDKYGRTCNICGEEILKLSDLELDHTKPYSKGGEKMALAHKECNRMKGSKTLRSIQTKMKLKPKG